MKKISVILLTFALIFGMNFGVLAVGGDDSIYDSTTTQATLEVCPYATIEFFENELYNGLFPEPLEGMSGLYVSDGKATRTAANGIWGRMVNGSYVAGVEDAGSAIYDLDSNNNFVAPFVVDMNTPININMEVDWENWAKVPTLFRVSSDESLSYGGLGGNGIEAWEENLAMMTNVNELIAEDANLLSFAQSSGFSNYGNMEKFNNFGEDGEWICEGPFEFHLNSAVYLPKVGSVLAGEEYSADITLTVSAAPATGVE
ncbi:MAG: hypothetical protein ACOCRX_02390 [Candidatus Woesearchaeota archaeon]